MHTCTRPAWLEIPARTPWTAALVLAGALYLRLPYPGPEWAHVDERAFILLPLGFWSGDLNPHFFFYPTFHLYAVSLLYYIYYLISGADSLLGFVAYHYFADHHELLVLARWLTTVLSVSTVGLVILLGRRLCGYGAGLAAGVIIAVLPLHTRFSHLATLDVPLTFWLTLSLFFAVGIVRRGAWRDYLVAGLCAGLAMSTKYPGVAGLAVVVAAGLLRVPSQQWARLSSAVLVAGSVAALSSPYVWLDWQAALSDIAAMQADHLQSAGEGIQPALHLVRHTLYHGAGLPVLVSAGSSFLLLRRAPKEVWLVVISAAVCALLPAFSVAGFMRYATPLAPVLAVLAACTLHRVARQPRIAALWMMALIASPLYNAAHTRAMLSGTDTRIEARAWLERHVPSGCRIAWDQDRAGRIPVLTTQDLVTLEHYFLRSFTVGDLERAYLQLEQRGDLPRLYVARDLSSLEALAAEATDGATSPMVAVWSQHPLRVSSYEPGSTGPDWLESTGGLLQRFRPGRPGAAVYDPRDWYFIPVSGWRHVSAAGPEIALWGQRVRIPKRAPTLREYLQIRGLLLAFSHCVDGGEWDAAQRIHRQVEERPFIMSELYPNAVLHGYSTGVKRLRRQEKDSS